LTHRPRSRIAPRTIQDTAYSALLERFGTLELPRQDKEMPVIPLNNRRIPPAAFERRNAETPSVLLRIPKKTFMKAPPKINPPRGGPTTIRMD
jgi:hypothetical protein